METINSIKSWASRVINTLEEIVLKEQQFADILEEASRTNEILNLEQDFVCAHFTKVFDALVNEVTLLIGNAPAWIVPDNYLLIRRQQIVMAGEDVIQDILTWLDILDDILIEDPNKARIFYKARAAEDVLAKLEGIKFALEQQKAIALKLFSL